MVKLTSKKLLLFTSAAIIMVACKKPTTKTGVEKDVPEVPKDIPNYSKSSNDNLAFLGRVLFYDKKLSVDNSISCGSCHKQSNGFADNSASSEGVDGQLSKRNTPSVFPKNGRMFWDGRAKNLNEMVIMPISNPAEMNVQNFDELCSKLSGTIYYAKLFKAAFNDENITKERIRTALAEFVRNFEFTNNKFKSSTGLLGKALTSDENKGRDLFFGKAKCGECHHVDNSGMGSFGNGYGQTDESHNIGLDYESTDLGCGEISNNKAEHGQFMMPVLLNVELTAPYMHDGRFGSLEEVVEHYNSKVVLSPTLDWRLKDFSDFKDLNEARAKLDKNFDGQVDDKESPNRQAQKLNLNDGEKAQIVTFLKTLTDKNIVSDAKYSNPFIH